MLNTAHTIARKARSSISFAALLASCVLTLPAQTPQPTPEAENYARGLALLDQLHGDDATDTPLLKNLGVAPASTLLMAVMMRGQGTAATPQEWTAMHRAIDALVELYLLDNQVFKASMFAGIQSMAYGNDEQDYTLALAASRRELDLQQRSGLTSTLYIPWENVAKNLIRLGQTEEGIKAYKQALAISDLSSPAAAAIWQDLIDVEVSQGDFPAAHTELATFLLRSEALPSKVYKGRALLAKANVAIGETRYNDALDSLHASLEIVKGDEKAEEFKWEVLTRLLLVGSSAMDSAPYPEAKALCARMDKEFPGMPISISAFAQEVLNHRRRLAGDFDALLREETATLDAARAAHDVPSQVGALLTLSVDYQYVNEIAQTITSLEEAVTLMNAAAPGTISPFLRNRVLLVMANAYIAKKDVSHANATLNTVVHEIDALKEGTAKQRMQDAYGEAQIAKARVAVLDDDPDTARDIFAKALNPKPGQFGHYTRSEVLFQAARLERDAKEQPAKAEQLYLQAIDELHKQKDPRTEIFARLQLARFLATDGARLPNSQQTAAEQIKAARTATTSIALADALWRLDFLDGVIAQNAGHNDAAIASYRRAVDELDKIREGLSQGEQRQSFLDDDEAQQLYRRLATLLTLAGQRDAAWNYIERDKARTFLESLRGRRFTPPATTPTPAQLELASLEQQILSARVALTPSNEAILRGAGQQPEVIQVKLRALETKFTFARQQAGLAQSRATQPLSLHPLTLTAMQHLLPAHAALIEYTVLDGELAAFVVSRTAATQLHWPADTRSLPVKLRQFHDALAAQDSGPELQTQLAEMSTLIFGAVAKAIPTATQTLIIVPAQGLAYIPFQALTLPDGKQVLDRYTVTYLPSASTLQFLKPGATFATTKPFVGALGNVSVDGWAPLPGTLVEAAGIRTIYTGVTPVTGPAFTHQVAVHALETNDEVHFATHGLFDEDSPLFSAILTSPSPGYPARLSLYEVMDLHLKARLIILSACETNRGRLMGGDEVSGLTRTFLQAGAEDVVSSLWKVSDESTALLMRSFHTQLHAGKHPAQALREAELVVRKQYPAPFYWAAFVNTGLN